MSLRNKLLRAVIFPVTLGFLFLSWGCITKDGAVTQMEKENIVLNKAYFPKTPEEIKENFDKSMEKADAALQAIVEAKENNFKNTIVAINNILYEIEKMIGPQYLLMNVSDNEDIRNAAEESVLQYDQWATEIFFRQDLFEAVDKVTAPASLKGEDLLLYEDTLKTFKRNGFGLPLEKRNELESLKVENTKLSTEFDTNIRNFNQPVTFTPEELEGVPDTSLAVLTKSEEGNYIMNPKIWSHYAAIATFAVKEETRLKAHIAKRSVAKEINPPVLEKIIKNRIKIASLLGYNNFADYIIEEKMAKDSKTARAFLTNMAEGVEKKFQQEQQSLLDIKIRETGDPDSVLNYWDNLFYERILFNEKYELDMEAMKKYFSMESCLDGVFSIYQKIFGISIMQKEAPGGYLWHKDVLFYEVTDAATGEALGSFYLDLYPREGKYNHFAEFGIISGNVNPDGTRERPVCALVCNFPKPTTEQPSLLSFDEVNTLFHEFGHAMHVLLSKTKYSSYHGTAVAGDFVEAPSQMLEQWLLDKEVLDLFAFDYKDPTKTIPEDFLDKIEASNKAMIARNTRGQIAYGMMDLVLHMDFTEKDDIDVVSVCNNMLEKYWMSYTDETAMIASFGHLAGGYAAGYYGYKWAEAISYDMASLFKKSPKGFLDEQLGMRLRKEIYEPGGSREENISIEAFLGRPWSNDAFFEYLGIK